MEESDSVSLFFEKGLPGKIALESLAHKSGYEKRGVLDELPHQGAASVPSEFPAKLYTALPLADIVTRVEASRTSTSGAAAATGDTQRHMSSVPLVVSNDAGQFLCDFIFYTSLAEEAKRQTGRAVQFLHIPPLPDRLQQQQKQQQEQAVSTSVTAERTSVTIGGSSQAGVQSLVELLRSKNGQDGDKSERYPFDELLEVTKSIVWHIACT